MNDKRGDNPRPVEGNFISNLLLPLSSSPFLPLNSLCFPPFLSAMLAAIIIASALTCGASQPPINAYYIEADPSNPGDSFAAQYLSTWVASAAGVNPLPIVPPGNSPAGAPILGVGFAAASLLDPTPPAGGWSTLGAEGHLLQTGLGSKSSDTAVTGAPGAPRGTLYAAYALVEKLGVRFWAPNVTSLPGTNVTTLPDLNLTYVPPLEVRISPACSASYG